MVTPLKNLPLRPPKSPNLLIAPVDYSQQYQDQLLNALRLYFAEIDNFGAGLTTSQIGGIYLKFPHIGASDTTDQYASADNTPTIVQWNTLDYGSGFTLNPSYYAVAEYSGIYKIDYSLQFANTDNAQHDIDVWLRVNETDVVGSASKFSIQARKSAGVYTFIVAYSSIVFAVEAGDQIALWWATDKAYSTTGPVDGVYMEYQAAQTSPFAHPSVPSAIGSITFVSGV